jgi:predicted DNA binding CopG/RHH family protein
MNASALIAVRVTPELKASFHACAVGQSLSESALLKRLLDLAISSGDLSKAIRPHSSSTARSNRLSVRLTSDDRQRLSERARARHIPPATYVSQLVHAHLHERPPIPEEELRALIEATNALSALGRNLNQIARVANIGIQPDGPSRQQLADVMQGCLALRDRMRAFIAANNQSWRSPI